MLALAMVLGLASCAEKDNGVLPGVDQLRENYGHSETLYACNTYQFADYSRYAMTVFKEEDKRKYRDEHFSQDLKNAFELGKRLVNNCQKQE